jgi:hypothetical protein
MARQPCAIRDSAFGGKGGLADRAESQSGARQCKGCYLHGVDLNVTREGEDITITALPYGARTIAGHCERTRTVTIR